MPDILKHIGLFGGTFDPIHFGHLAVAENVKKRFDLEAIYFIPAAQPPHKPAMATAKAQDRMEMLRRAVSGLEGFTVSDVELNRSGPSFTVDTISYFNSVFSKNTKLLFILGLDAFLEIDTWKSYKALFHLVPFVVISRSSSELPGDGIDFKHVERFIRSKISDTYHFSKKNQCFIHDENQPVHIYSVQPVNISSTLVRERVRNALSIGNLVPESVEKYINRKGLYR